LVTRSRRDRTPVLVNTFLKWPCTVCTEITGDQRYRWLRNLQHEARQFLLPFSQAVGRHQERGNPTWVRRFDDDSNSLTLDSRKRYTVQDDPAARPGQHPSDRYLGGVICSRGRTRCTCRHGKNSGRQSGDRQFPSGRSRSHSSCAPRRRGQGEPLPASRVRRQRSSPNAPTISLTQ
jgi:hypothetical protein